MPPNRADALKSFIEKSPNDPFPRYGLAMELKTQGRLDESHGAFGELEQRFPDYVPQYLMHLNVLVALKRKDEARAVGERGMAAAQRKGDGHAAGELQSALDSMEDAD